MKIILSNDKNGKIKILKAGPYVITGCIPLVEKIIISVGNHYEYKTGYKYTMQDEYALCRCGHSKHMPFCDGCHQKSGFVGNETASRMNYIDRAELREGPQLTLLDDNRCAFVHFCHREEGKVWNLIDKSDDPNLRN